MMNTKIEYMNNIVLKIQNLAKIHLGDPQKLYQTLQKQTVVAMKLGYSSNLMLATGSSGVDIDNHFEDVHNVPYKQIDDRRIYKNLWSQNEKQIINLKIPSTDLYIACDNVPLKTELSNGKDMAIRYRRLNYYDVYEATQRFFKAEHKLNSQQLEPTKKSMLLKVAHDGRISQHGFIREALDDLFVGTTLNYQTGQVEFSQMLAYDVSNAITDNPFHTTKSYRYYVYWIPELLLGGKFALKNAKKLHDVKTVHDYQQKLKAIQQLKSNGLDYVVYVFNKNKQIVKIHRVTKIDMKYVVQATIKYLKSL